MNTKIDESNEINAAGYVLVDNESYDLAGIYYGGPNERYADMFNITIPKYAQLFPSAEAAQGIAERLNSAGYHFQVEPRIKKDERKQSNE